MNARQAALRRRTLAGIAGLVFLAPGCATVQPDPTLRNEAGLPIQVAFLYEEKVYSTGASFSLASCFWEHGYPILGGVFREARRYGSQWEALQSPETELLVVAENIIHGSPAAHKFSMALRVVTRDEKTIMTKSIQQQTGSLESCGETLSGMAVALKEALQTSSRVVNYANRRTVVE